MIVTMLGPNLLFVFFDLDFEVTKEGSQDLTEASKPITNSLFSLGKTPVNLVHLKNELKSYPDKAVAEELAHGFEFGFPLYYTGSRMPKESKKLKTANEIDQHKLLTEINFRSFSWQTYFYLANFAHWPGWKENSRFLWLFSQVGNPNSY